MGVIAYTARIGRQFRDIHGISPKVCLVDIVDEEGNQFRDHCWVPKCRRMETVIPKGNKYVEITFTAKVREYVSSTGNKPGLQQIRNVTIKE